MDVTHFTKYASLDFEHGQSDRYIPGRRAVIFFVKFIFKGGYLFQ